MTTRDIAKKPQKRTTKAPPRVAIVAQGMEEARRRRKVQLEAIERLGLYAKPINEEDRLSASQIRREAELWMVLVDAGILRNRELPTEWGDVSRIDAWLGLARQKLSQ